MASDEQTEWINQQYSHSASGEVITLQIPLISVNIELIACNEAKQQLWKDFSLVPGWIVLPICEGYTNSNNDTAFTAVHGGRHYKPSKVKLESRFAVEVSFAMTIHKAEGETMSTAILALSKPPSHSLTYCHIYVAFSCIHGCDDICLLLNGNNEGQKWDLLA